MKLVGPGQSSSEGDSRGGANRNITHICHKKGDEKQTSPGASEDGASSRRKYRRVAFQDRLITNPEERAPSVDVWQGFFRQYAEEEKEADINGTNESGEQPSSLADFHQRATVSRAEEGKAAMTEINHQWAETGDIRGCI